MANPLRPFMIARRAELKFTQEQAAQKAGCSPGTWVRWESPFRLPTVRAWLKIAAALRIPLETLQRAAGKTLLELSGGNPAQPGEANAAAKPVEPEEYEFLSGEAHTLDRMLRNVDLHKLHQTGWHYHMSEWRGSMREQVRGLDHLVRSLRNQLDLFVKMHHILLGNETGRIVPLRPPKMKPPSPKRGQKPKGGKGRK